MKERYERRKIMERKKITIGYLMSEDFVPTPFKEMADADKLAIMITMCVSVPTELWH